MDTSTEAFIDFVETDPGLPAWTIAQYKRIDKQAVKAGLILNKKDIRSLRLLAADPKLSPDCRSRNAIMADSLERDPTGRLAAVPSLRAWADKYDVEQLWVSWYVTRVNAWLDASKAPPLVPLQATSQAMEVVR